MSKRLPRENCNCIGELAIEFAKECVEALKVSTNSAKPETESLTFLTKGWEGRTEGDIPLTQIFDVDKLSLVAMYYVAESGGAYHADVESTLRV